MPRRGGLDDQHDCCSSLAFNLPCEFRHFLASFGLFEVLRHNSKQFTVRFDKQAPRDSRSGTSISPEESQRFNPKHVNKSFLAVLPSSHQHAMNDFPTFAYHGYFRCDSPISTRCLGGRTSTTSRTFGLRDILSIPSAREHHLCRLNGQFENTPANLSEKKLKTFIG